MNYFQRKTFLQLLEKRAVTEAYEREQTVNVEQYTPEMGTRDLPPERANGSGGTY